MLLGIVCIAFKTPVQWACSGQPTWKGL